MKFLYPTAAGLTLLLGVSATSQATTVQFQTVLGDFEVEGASINSEPPLAFMAFRCQGGFATVGLLPI